MQPKFEAVRKLDGFDDTVNPHWLMIGTECEKSVILNKGNSFSAKIRNPKIAEIVNDVIESVSLQQRIITIRGKNKGTTHLDVFDGNIRKAHLEVCVKNRREIRVSFHYVHDNAGNNTIRNASTLLPLLSFINNKVFLPQANVFVRLGTYNDPLRIERNLGEVVRDTSAFPDISKREHEVDLIMAKGDKTAHTNVFFVTNIEIDRDPKINATGGIKYDHGIFIDDNVNSKSPLGTIESTLVHELCHYLGVGGESHYRKLRNINGAMYYKARGGLFIGKVHANMINR